MFTAVNSFPRREELDLNPFQFHPQIGLDDVPNIWWTCTDFQIYCQSYGQASFVCITDLFQMFSTNCNGDD